MCAVARSTANPRLFHSFSTVTPTCLTGPRADTTLGIRMTRSTRRLRTLVAALLVSLASHATAEAEPSLEAERAIDALLYRIFLRDGSTLVSYGDFVRVADR